MQELLTRKEQYICKTKVDTQVVSSTMKKKLKADCNKDPEKD